MMPVIEKEVFKAPGEGVAMAMYNLDDSIRNLPEPAELRLEPNYPVYLSTRTPFSRPMTGAFKDIFHGDI